MALKRFTALAVLVVPAYAAKTIAEIKKEKKDICASHPSNWSTCSAWDHSTYENHNYTKSFDEDERTGVYQRYELVNGEISCLWGHGSVDKDFTDNLDATCVEVDVCTAEPTANTCRCLSKGEAWNKILSLRTTSFAVGLFMFFLAQILIQYGVWGCGTNAFNECVPLEGDELEKARQESVVGGDTNIQFLINAFIKALVVTKMVLIELSKIPYYWVSDVLHYFSEGRVDEKGRPVPIVKAYGVYKKVGVLINFIALIILAQYAEASEDRSGYVCSCGNIGVPCNGAW